MGDVADRAVRIVGTGASSVVSSAASALMLAAGVVAHDPALATLAVPVAAMAGAAADEGVAAVARLWRAEGVQTFKDAVEEITNEPIEDLLGGDLSRKTRRLLGESVIASSDAVDEWTVNALARSFVAGAQDSAKVDPMRDLVRVLAGVEGKHARVMAVLAEAPYQWTVDDVAKVDTGLGHTVAILARDLERLGLVLIRGNVASLSIVGWSCAALLKELGSLPEVGVGSVS